MIKSCKNCPDSGGCAYDDCNVRYLSGACPEGECDLLKDGKLVGLPDYCNTKDKQPPRCPLVKASA